MVKIRNENMLNGHNNRKLQKETKYFIKIRQPLQ